MFCLLIVNFVNAEPGRWSHGVIVLHSDEVVSGNIQVEQSHNVVFVQHGTRVDVYPAHRVRSVYCYDADANINRKFITISGKNDRRRHNIYEVVAYGDVTVLRRPSGIFSDPADDGAYTYFLFHDESLIGLQRFSTELFPQLVRASPDLSAYVREHKLDTTRPADAIRIVLHHNKSVHHPDISSVHKGVVLFMKV
ncbi:MAG TPA: hypothetical protein VD816_03420 [Ohtaekwangia sp.]|nr:hypothetical protein [Ohtaekwangia sp.]